MSSISSRTSRIETWRLFVVYGVVFIALVALLARMITLQVIGKQGWLDLAVENYTRAISVRAQRGIIYDRNGYILARNTASYNILITPANLPDDDADIQRVYREVSDITGIPVTSGTLEEAKLFAACVEGPGIAQLVELGDSLAPYTPVKIKCNVPDELARIVQEKSVDWPGVSVEVEPIRDYPTGSLTANLIGFLGPIPASLEEELRAQGFVPNRDKIGYAGVEASMQALLSGKNGTRVIQIDVAGKELRNLEPPVAPIPGNNIMLTIDTRLQAAAEASLKQEVDYWNKYFNKIRISSGTVIAMNPKTGEILAMVSYPTYENNRMARFIPSYYYQQLSTDPTNPLLNIAISAEFSPGSVFKLATATGAINEGVVTTTQEISAPGQLLLCEKFSPTDPCIEGRNMRPFRDHIYDTRPDGFGIINFYYCIAYSSNVCFYKLGGGYEDEIKEGLGIVRLKEYARAIGYEKRSGIQLLGEQDGLIPDPDWKRINQGENWSTGDTYIASVGQGYVLATPLQVLMSGSTIANNGKLMQPTIIREVTDGEGRVIPVWFNPEEFTFSNSPVPGAYQVSPFTPNMKWDVTTTPLIEGYNCDQGYCDKTGQFTVIKPSSIEAVRAGTRLAVTAPNDGTLHRVFMEDYPLPITVAGKTGTAEYCDDVALKADRCKFGLWPTHAWTLAYAPYEDPEIIVLAFAYNGGEGASVAAPIVARVIQAYFELKAIDTAQAQPGGG
jgi:penicillin-binding protein 2